MDPSQQGVPIGCRSPRQRGPYSTPINIIGHITFDELRRDLTQTDMANGFANRIAFACVRRSKLLPRGGGVVDLTGITPRLTRILAQRPAGELTRTGAAWEIWEQAYPALTQERPGMLGAILGRGAPQVLRLAVTYARLDRASEIGVPHLRAALACWKYAEQSARYIFGDSMGDPVADAILHALRQVPAGLTRTDLSSQFGRHKSSEEIGRALGVLQRAQLITYSMEPTGGRPVERFNRDFPDGLGCMARMRLLGASGNPRKPVNATNGAPQRSLGKADPLRAWFGTYSAGRRGGRPNFQRPRRG